MDSKQIKSKTVCIAGLGYVGLPLADSFARHLTTIGFDIDARKVSAIAARDANSVQATSDPARIADADFVLICVPTPVTRSKEPDLRYVISASETVGKNLKPGACVVLESTVYPGVTEDVVRPILERESGGVCGVDFTIGYSPERINPSDSDHTLDRITKIVSGYDAATAEDLAALYGLVTTVYVAPDIKTAEAAKVIENIQRDLNIALMNELSIIFHRMRIDTAAVLKAAGTKWNFHQYTPGLVGGHCIPVDPYYLVYRAKELGYHPQVILAGRAINDHIPRHVADMVVKGLNEQGRVIKGSNVLIMGLTYKENVPDTRESPVTEIVRHLSEFGVELYGYDPLLPANAIETFGVQALEEITVPMDAVIIAVAHDQFRDMSLAEIGSFMNSSKVLVDIRGIFAGKAPEKDGFYYRTL
ncbi:nucleotide sugar dehydrogenase [Methanoculleus sp. FWC-SCC1]|uniref:UDP-N-acetyl-D-mannosamine dehydrogenase n=1 Tax=Methanoculleus frigidifontis TaxID=2584085 RepID=A0ABT8MD52_9EURY|nr:nucleotide sugar dehydrogenase [Methanoculleus sp. FWC-SCC1]MDN7025878.1 nucleotide sugar dehydrogenase [Methanoculleus sp. FWC-SCC1]